MIFEVLFFRIKEVLDDDEHLDKYEDVLNLGPREELKFIFRSCRDLLMCTLHICGNYSGQLKFGLCSLIEVVLGYLFLYMYSFSSTPSVHF
jgi:hypothetical protein